MRKIAILGGTFNPIHNGHIMLALSCHSVLQFDKIIVIPTNIAPHKETPDLCSNQDRLAMCKLAVKGNPLFEVSDLEFQLGGTSYTCITLKKLKELYPADAFYFLIGSDMLHTFRSWKNYREILSMCTIVAASRSRNEYEGLLKLKESFRTNEKVEIAVIDNIVCAVSSTEVRKKIKEHNDVSGLIDPHVYQYIIEHRLFME